MIEKHVGDPVMTVHAFVSEGAKPPHVVIKTQSHRVDPSVVLAPPEPVTAVGAGTGDGGSKPHAWKMVPVETTAAGGGE